MTQTAWNAYDQASNTFFETYESLTFENVHKDFLEFLPEPGAQCVDVGAGSGRDAAALARLGYHVTAVEPSRGMMELAQQRHSKSEIEWLQGCLPQLSGLEHMRSRASFVLVSAVWMHIAPSDRAQSLQSLKALLAPGGFLALTLRLGPPSPERVMHTITTESVIAQALEAGFRPVYISEVEQDSLRRQEIVWQKLVLAPG